MINYGAMMPAAREMLANTLRLDMSCGDICRHPDLPQLVTVEGFSDDGREALCHWFEDGRCEKRWFAIRELWVVLPSKAAPD